MVNWTYTSKQEFCKEKEHSDWVLSGKGEHKLMMVADFIAHLP